MTPASGYNLAASDYDKKEKFLDSFEKNLLLPMLGDIRCKKILDVGAGTGRLSLRLAEKGADVVALDISEKMLAELINKNKKINIVVGNAEQLPFEDNYFDAVAAAFLIVHLKDPRIFFDEVYRVLKDGGQFIVTNVNQKEPPVIQTTNKMIKIESYYHRPETIREILESLAFNIKREEIVKENGVWVNQILVAVK